ncbi:uncharacterized protein L203_100299 [Cryptococcus depauperatus CBS 7841]|uniref:Uncharacterized protein n=1 Tax=Cryptococcus depauperatus CBS 7841 TaxID=1295531 RepID=A0A1E3IZN3_9TREE|nr:peptidyl-tRNA hydrolase ICT1 [Cryptococcus depauperatus CBS 7841]
MIIRLCAIRSITSSACAQGKLPAQPLSLIRLVEESDHAWAREWVDGFTVDDIPKEGYLATKSRSSGPGGQHVNKTESKVTVRCDLDRAVGKWLPKFVMPALTKSPYYHSSPPCLLISSQRSRHASQNQDNALSILHQSIVSSADSLIINPTSAAQKEKVKMLERQEKERKMEMKKRRSMKKASRRE